MGKKSIIILMLLISMLMFGCAIQQQAMPSSSQETGLEEEVVQETTTETTPAPAQQTTPAPAVQPAPAEQETTTASGYNFETFSKEQQRKIKLVRNLLNEVRTKEENCFFRYSGPGILQTDVWVKGNVVKRQIKRPTEIDKYNHYNMVYMYKDTKKAWGYCETTKAKCWMGNGPFDEKYQDWIVKTPKDWALELGDEFTWALDNKIGDQLYHIVDYRESGKTIRVYVNDYRGVPYRIDIYNKDTPIDSIPSGTADETYIYDDMDIGGVSEDDVTPPV